MHGYHVSYIILGFIVTSYGVQGECPFAGSSLSPADEAAILEAVEVKADEPPIVDKKHTYKLYTGEHLLKTTNPDFDYNIRVPRDLQISNYDLRSAVQQSFREVETTRSYMAPLHEKGGPASLSTNSSAYGHFVNFRARDESIDLNALSYALIRATGKLQREYSGRYGMTPYNFIEFLHSHGYIISDISGACRSAPVCSKKTLYYRTIDGSCNNPYNTAWGMSRTPLVRITEPSYRDAIYKPTASVTGMELPSASLVSLVLFHDVKHYDPVWTRSLMVWGQLMGHDMSLSPSTQSKKGPIQCCSTDHSNPLPKSQLNPSCLPIEVPDFHPFYSKFGVRCINFVRSMTVPTDGCKLGPGHQMNVVTSYLDLSPLYGSTKEVGDSLRTFQGGILASSFSKEAGGEILPSVEDKLSKCDIKSESESCYKAGDVRVNLHLDLTILQTMLMRWHNEIARALEKLNPHWDDEKLYQEARKISIAGYQHICYHEWLPILLGKKFSLRYGIWRQDEDEYGYVHDYDPDIPASVINEHTTSAFRFLHSTVPGVQEMLSPERNVFDIKHLSDTYNKPGALEEQHVFNGLLTGLVTQPMDRSDRYFTHELTRYLFKGDRHFGMDLESIDIQRHRDHGLGSYNQLRHMCGLRKAKQWEDFLDVMTESHVYKLQSLYLDVNDVDLMAGCAMEKLVKGSLLGPTALCIIGEQFYRTRRGDRFFYMNGEKPGHFTPAQLAEIKKYTWSRFVCDTSNLQEIQREGFRRLSEKNPIVSCRSIPGIDLSHWKVHPDYK